MNDQEPQPDAAKQLAGVDRCDIHTFNSHHLGIGILHPGGLEASAALAALCGMQPGSAVLDIACGKGTSSRFLAGRFGCQVTGVDIDEDYIKLARTLPNKYRALEGRMQFMVADAEKLPFADGAFDIAIFQSVLVLMEHAGRAVQEAARVVRPGGRVGFLEMTWLERPSPGLLEEALNTCGHCYRLATANHGDWQALIRESGLELKEARMFKNEATKIGEEGAATVLKALWRLATDASLRNRFRRNNAFFLSNLDRIGYGLYVGVKA